MHRSQELKEVMLPAAVLAATIRSEFWQPLEK